MEAQAVATLAVTGKMDWSPWGSWGRTLRLYDPKVFHKHLLLHTLCEGTAQNLGSKRTQTVGTVPNKENEAGV